MFKTHQYIAMILTAAILISGCDKTVDDITGTAPDVSTGIAIDFSADLNNNLGTTTRSSAETINDFLVNTFFTKDGKDTTIMPKYLVKKDGSNWTYNYDNDKGQELQYWDTEADSYVFSAVSYLGNSITSDSSQVSFETGGKIKITNVTPEKDWVIARTKRTNGSVPSDKDSLANTLFTCPNDFTFTSDVPLNFHHLLAKVEFRIFSGTGKLVNLDTLEIAIDKIYKKASFTESASSEWAYDGEVAIQSVNKGKLNVTALAQTNAQPIDSILVIPQSLERVSMKVTTNLGEQKTFPFEETDAWERNKKYIYYLKLTTPTNIILIDVKVADWVKADPIDGGKVTNW